MLLNADTMLTFFKAGQQLMAPDETSKLVLTTHYDISITSRLAKNI